MVINHTCCHGDIACTTVALFLLQVFCSSLLFEQNVMVEVATKQLDNPVSYCFNSPSITLYVVYRLSVHAQTMA